MINENRAKQIIDLFFEFVAKQQNGRKAEFKSGYLLDNEGYKAGVYIRANDILRSKNWNKKMIRSGEIAHRMIQAVEVKDNNFIAWRHKDEFKKALRDRPTEAGQVFFEVFREDDGNSENTGTDSDAIALERFVSFMGSRDYDLISTLFYMKNPDRYYPCKPRFFRRAFVELGMDPSCFNSCTYENYVKFNDGIREIAVFFSNYAGHIDVLDAHSFAWIIGAYDEARAYIFDTSPEEATAASAPSKEDDDLPRQERKSTVMTRLRQSDYRRNLLNYWGGRCAVTGCGLTDILIDSHVKPWSKCETNRESISKYNGFLLTPNLDRLFDHGYITFDDDGRIIISKNVPQSDYETLGIHSEMRLRRIEQEHRSFLAYHYEKVFKG